MVSQPRSPKASLDRPRPVLTAALDSIRLDVYVDLDTDHGLREGDDLQVMLVEDGLDGRRSIDLVGVVASVHQAAAGNLVGPSPMVVRLKNARRWT